MATLTGTPNHDKKKGTAQADSMSGLAGNDTLSGLSGNDTLLGGIGTDSLDGGTDNDRLMGDVGNDTLLGGAGNDYLDGGADNDKLDGGAGADTLDGGTGTDAMSGGDGDDLYRVDNIADKLTEAAKATSGIDTVESSIDFTLPLNIEHLILTGLAGLKAMGNALANRITGNAGDNLLDGGNGFDTLIGGAGDDTLIGGIGFDQLTGGDGSDTYQVSSTEDTLLETAKGGDQDVVESSVSYTLASYLEVLTLTGKGSISGTGNELANTLEGNGSDNTLNGEVGNDTLRGNAGDDTLQGGAGDDEMDGGEGDDAVIYPGNKADYKIHLDEASQTWVVEDINGRRGDRLDEGTDRLRNVETLRFADGPYLPGQGLPGLTVGNISLAEGQAGTQNATFSFTLSERPRETATVDYATLDDTAQSGSDYIAEQGTLTFEEGQTEQKLKISVLGDTNLEPDETFLLRLSNPVGLAPTLSEVTATIVNDESPSLAIESESLNVSVAEGKGGDNRILLKVSLSQTSSQPVSVQYASAPGGTATAGIDYAALTGTLTFAPNTSTQTIPVTIKGDTEVENDEYFRVVLSNPQNARLDTTAGSATITVRADDRLALRIQSDQTGRLKVGDTPTLTLTFSDTPKGFTASDLSVSGGGIDRFRALSDTQYTARFVPTANQNQLTARISVAAATYTDRLNQPGPASNLLTFSGDTLAPGLTLSSDKTSLKAGETATLSFRFSEVPTGFDASDITVSGGTLGTLSGSDLSYTAPFTLTAASSSLSVAAGSYADMAGNPGPASNSLSLRREQPALPTLTITEATVTEGQSGARFATLNLSLSAAVDPIVTVNYATRDDTAQAGSDYLASNNVVSFAPGQRTATLQIPILGDTLLEPDERFTVQLSDASNALISHTASRASVVIRNDDQPPLPDISIASLRQAEGNTAAYVNLSLRLSSTASQPVTVNYTTQDGSAKAGVDYTASQGSVTFTPGQTRQTLSLLVLGDTGVEPDERFQVTLASPLNAALATHSSATVTLTNDDAAAIQPTLAISGTRVNEGQSGVTSASLTVSLSAAASQPVSVNYSIVNGTALAGSDYQASSGTLSFAPGQTSQTISIPVIGDTTVEPDENFQVQLSNPQNANLSTTRSALIDLLNDDTIQFGNYTQGQAVINLGKNYGKLIHPVQVDGGRWFYFWDVSGDGTRSSTQGAGYANRYDFVTHDWLDTIFQQDVNGRLEGENGAPVVYNDGDTDNTYRFATLNGVKLALPTIGNGVDRIVYGEEGHGYQNGTAVSGTASNPTYDDYLAIWDAYNGTGTGTGDYGTPGGWHDTYGYWSATPSASGHAFVSLGTGNGTVTYDGISYYVAVEVW